MFNGKYKKEAMGSLEHAKERYQDTFNRTMKDITRLHDTRQQEAVPLLKQIEVYISNLANRPKEYDKIVQTITVRRQNFEENVHRLEMESQKADKVSGSVAGAGVVAGAGIAAFGPTAAMAVATTFGTASTGTAIATLSGAAATKAALAWLGGGALVAGGGGIVAGETLLALAGPVGWAIGGTALLGSGIMASSKNKKIAEKAEQATREIKEATEEITEKDVKVVAIFQTTMQLISNIRPLFFHAHEWSGDYIYFSDSQKYGLQTLMNSAEALSAKLGEVVS